MLLFWQLPLATLETNLNADTLFQTDLYQSPPPAWTNTSNATSAPLYDFTVGGTAVDAAMYNMYLDPAMFPPTAYSYMVAVQTGTTLGIGLRMLQTFNVDPGVLGDDRRAQGRLHSAHLLGEPAEPDDHRGSRRDAEPDARLVHDDHQRARRRLSRSQG